MNPVEIEEAVSNLALEPFDRREFPFQFLAAFDNKDTTIRLLKSGKSNASDVPGAVLQRNNIHIATCDVGEVDATLNALRASPKTASAKAKFILATDGESFQAEDLTGGGTVACAYADFPDHFGFFLPLAGITTVEQIKESSFDVKATGRLNRLYIELLKDNPDWAAAERQHDMNHFMARLIFCFFAEDTDIFFGERLFTGTVEQWSARDSSDTHMIIGEIFRAMDTKSVDRDAAGLPRYAVKFPYVNGELFAGSTDVPRFSKVARSYLLHIGSLNWKKINPDIFGSMIQAVTDDAERSSLGMHYTSVPNILKVLNPLFLDDLREKLEDAGDNTRKLLNLRNRMARIRVFDPACGSGNFLVIAYKEMRQIEAEINRRRGEPDRRSDIPLTNFRGIELRAFPAEIARLALIIAEYQCDVFYRGQKEALAEFLPLDSENWITCGNALRLDWLSVCPPTGVDVRVTSNDLFQTPLDQSEIEFANEGGETYICGNPPYLGSTWQSVEQKSDLELAFSNPKVKTKLLDYVTGWFVKAANYSLKEPTRFAFVATNSICQGQQVPIFWPLMLQDHQIGFAYPSFRWANLASNKAGVTVAIVGLVPKGSRARARLMIHMDDDSVLVRDGDNISPYLTFGSDQIVEPAKKNLNGFDDMVRGNTGNDGGNLYLSPSDLDDLGVPYDDLKKFTRKVYGSDEFIRGGTRYCLWIEDSMLEQALTFPSVAKRVEAVRNVRLSSSDPGAQKMARRPHQFREMNIAKRKMIVVPRVSSENREYLPAGLLSNREVISDRNFALYDGEIWYLSIIASRLHWSWVGTVCVRLRTDFSYSNTLGWNTFPVPKMTEQNKADLTRCAEDILLAREAHFPATIADLYDPEKMPDGLRRAHEANDEVLERIYIGRRFRNDAERLEKLFDLYTKMTTKPGTQKKAVASA
ncbi:class I SAM-dependent DNA methyltransferase [Brevundimonas diminuta]|uniref:class I SAM-dependent DNA methyltransferase n=1 Tax=Brevundimonas diminuta TaxID=293 RepID=UPI0037CC14F9